MSAVEMPPPTLFGLNTLQGENMTPPETRVQDASSLRGIARRMIIDDQPRSKERALTRGLLQGNPPYDPARRRAANNAWQANLNFLEGEASIDSARVPYYQLFSGVKQYAVCETNWGKDEMTKERASKIISKHFHNLLKSWRHFDWHMQNCFAEMLRWGYAPLIFDSGTSWKFKSIESRCILMPKDNPSVVDDRTVVVLIIEKYTVTELWNKIRDQKDSGNGYSDVGWNIKACRRAIIQAATGTGSTNNPWSQYPWEEWEIRLKNNDLYWTSNGQEIYCFRALVQEFREGKTKISQFIVSQNPIYDNSGSGQQTRETEDDDAGFLFRHVDRYDSFDEALILFFQNTGYGTFHSVRGMAMKGFKHWDASNRLKCKEIDTAFQRCAVVLETDTVESNDNLQLMVFSDRTILPRGTKVAQMGFSGDIEGVMAVDRMLTNHLANNLGVYNQRTMTREDGRGEQPTATQVQNQVLKEASLSQGQITVTYTHLDQLYTSIFSKAILSSEDDAVAFREACVAEGVPIEALKDMECVSANRTSGYGSTALRQQNLTSFAPYVPSLPEAGKSNWLDEMIEAFFGPDKVDVLNPKNYQPTEDDTVAASENGSIAAGSQPIISSGNNDVRHIQIHLSDVAQRMAPLQQAIQQGQHLDPSQLQTAYDYLSIMGPHIEQHLARIQNDPLRRAEAQQFEDQFKQLVSFHGMLRSAIIKARNDQRLQMEQQQNASALNELDQAKVQSMQVSNQIKVDKWNTDKAIKIDKAQTSSRLSTFKTLHDAKLNDYSTASDIHLDRAKTAASLNGNS